MPSPTATMRPTSADTRLASKSFNLSLMTSEISFVLIPNSDLLGGRQSASQLLQPRGDGRVGDVVAVLQSQPADDARVDGDGEPDLFLQLRRQLHGDALPVVRTQRDRRGDGGAHATRSIVGQALKLIFDRGRLGDSPGFDQQPGEVRRLCVK